MTPSTSTQIQSKDRIYTALKAAIPAALVTWGVPNWDPNKHHDRVAVADIDNASDWRNLGQRGREENYVVTVEIDVFRDGTACRDSEVAADALIQAVAQAMIDDYTLGGTVVVAVVDRTTLGSVEEDAGYHAHGTASIAVQARI